MGSCESTQSSSNGGSDEDLLVQTQRKKEREEMIQTAKTVGVAVGVMAGLALVGWGISKLASSGLAEKSNRKMMKAPGRGFYIYRDDFEIDPAGYFHNNRCLE